MALRVRALLVVWVLPAWLTACGPIGYVNQVTRRADSAVASARAADAERRSPYWWTRAVEYLRQARVEAAAADFQAANRFGRLATEAAERAREEALAGETADHRTQRAADAAGETEGAP